MRKIKLLLFSLLLVFTMSFSVYAAINIGGTIGAVDMNFCMPAGTIINNKNVTGAYHISYDSDKSSMVDYKKITFTDIINGHVPYPENIIDKDKAKYQFDVKFYSNNCYTDSEGNVQTCPTSEQIGKYDIYTKFNSDNYKKYVNFTLNESTGKFDVTIKANDLFKDNEELYVRYVKPGNEINSGDKMATNYNDFLSKNAAGDYKIYGVSGSKDGDTKVFNLEFYIKSGSCKNVLLGSVGVELPNLNDYEINNPALIRNDRNNYYGCRDVVDYIPRGMSNDEVEKVLIPLKKDYIPECYNARIKFNEKNNLKNVINNKLSNLKNIFKDYNAGGNTNDLKCEESHSKTKLSYSETGQYWSMTCFEKYTASGDTAKLVKAGNGFEYVTNYSVERTCNITQIRKAIRPADCQYDCGHICYWNESTGVKTGYDGGPSDDFDSCILECDNGVYTQSCINSCYNKVYKNKRDLSFIDKFSYDNTKSTTTRLSSCVTDHGRPGEASYGGCGEQFCVSDFCNNHGGYCVNWVNIYPAGCSTTAEADYAKALAASKRELENLLAKSKEKIDVGEYEYQIADSHLVTKNGNNYIYKVDSKTDPSLKVTSSQTDTNYENHSGVALGNSGGTTVNYSGKVVSKVNIKVSLPMSYVNKVTGEAIYKTSDSSTKAFSVDFKNNKFKLLNSFDVNYYYNNNERKYYTSIWSENLNVIPDCENNKIKLYRAGDYNIKVKSNKVGSADFSSNIKCFYGVYNEYYKNNDTLTCSNDSKGIQYIYRPIDLENMFPNRDARFNWTGTVRNNNVTGAAVKESDSMYDDSIDPESLISEIESKGKAIYDVSRDSSEVDYEFVLTTENIRNIRKYNKYIRDYNGDGSSNYLDYNMNCYRNNRGQEICTSRFLDNTDWNSGSESFANFITYSVSGFNITNRKSIAGCNNAIGGTACDNIGN